MDPIREAPMGGSGGEEFRGKKKTRREGFLLGRIWKRVGNGWLASRFPLSVSACFYNIMSAGIGRLIALVKY